ncbi:hypothetical protein D9M68_850610 [compost metagenome]
MDRQPMAPGVDGGHAVVMHGKVQTAGGDRAAQCRQRRVPGREAGALVGEGAQHRSFAGRWLAIGLIRAARRAHPRWHLGRGGLLGRRRPADQGRQGTRSARQRGAPHPLTPRRIRGFCSLVHGDPFKIFFGILRAYVHTCTHE